LRGHDERTLGERLLSNHNTTNKKEDIISKERRSTSGADPAKPINQGRRWLQTIKRTITVKEFPGSPQVTKSRKTKRP